MKRKRAILAVLGMLGILVWFISTMAVPVRNPNPGVVSSGLEAIVDTPSSGSLESIREKFPSRSRLSVEDGGGRGATVSVPGYESHLAF